MERKIFIIREKELEKCMEIFNFFPCKLNCNGGCLKNLLSLFQKKGESGILRPLIEDDGSISSSFKASPYETIIIGRDFRIKFKYGMADNRTIYNQVIRFAFSEKEPPLSKEEEIETLIGALSFKEVKSGKLSRVKDEINGRKTILNLFISTCMGCPEGRRVALLKDIAKKIGLRGKVIILFGRGNGLEMIRDWAERMELDEPISVGVIEGNSLDDEYLKIFRFDIDPRIFIFD